MQSAGVFFSHGGPDTFILYHNVDSLRFDGGYADNRRSQTVGGLKSRPVPDRMRGAGRGKPAEWETAITEGKKKDGIKCADENI